MPADKIRTGPLPLALGAMDLDLGPVLARTAPHTRSEGGRMSSYSNKLVGDAQRGRQGGAE